MRRGSIVLLSVLTLAACGGGGDDGGGDIIEAQPCDLMITEIMNFPSGTLLGNEWIEIHNPTTRPIDLTTVWIKTNEDARLWMLQDDLPGPVMVQPGEFFLVWQARKDEPVALAEDGAFRGLYLPQDLFDLTKTDLTITLRTQDGKELHSVVVGPAGTACDPGSPSIEPLSDDTKGASLELQEDFLACTDSILSCEAWAPAWQAGLIPDSTDLGSPGQGPEKKTHYDNPTTDDLAVTEILSRSGDACDGLYWFELYNFTGAPLTLEGCFFGDRNDVKNETDGKEVKSQIVVPAEGYAVVAGEDFDGMEEDGIIAYPHLNQSDDILFLFCNGDKIFEVAYGGGEGELLKPQEGKSIGVCYDDLEKPYTAAMLHDPANWAVTEAGATGCGDDIGSPGVQNLLCDCPPTCTPGICDVDDGCGGLCGCGENGTCVDGQCVCDVEPDCASANKECGDDGCGGSCGDCSGGLTCAQTGAGAWCARTPIAGEVVLTEVMAQTGSTCADGKADWFELKSLAGDAALNLEGCGFGDKNDKKNGATNLISQTVVIPSHGEIVIARGDMDGVIEDYVTSKPDYNQKEERIWLECPDGTGGVVTLFDVWYGTGDDADLPKPENGVSIQVCPNLLPEPAVAADYTVSEYWQLTDHPTGCGDDLGSPGLANPYCDCDPACPPGECGMDDGCGGTCGCPEGQSCVQGLCEGPCMPQCDGKECGPDGCGDVCGTCVGGLECIEGACVVPPAFLVVNEVNANITGGCDLVELRVITGGSLDGIVLRECKSKIVTFDPVEVATDDLVVVHFDSGDASCNPSGATAEVVSMTEFDALTYAVTYDTAWDVFVPDTGLTATTNVLTVYGPGGDIQDAVFLTEADDGDFTAGATEDQAEIVAAAGEWTDPDGTVPEGGYADAAFHASAMVGLKDTGTDSTGSSIQRTAGDDTNTKNDWSVAAQTWGAPNAVQ